MKKQDYGANQIKVLEGLEAVRTRPGMYIGDTNEKGLHHLVNEVLDNSVDEALAGYCNKIDVIIHQDNSITVEDNGRGIPTGINEQYQMSGVELALTKLHAGGKFGDENGAYKAAGGLHGVGISVVNALSENLEVEVKQNKEIHRMTFAKGKPQSKLKVIGKTKETGTKVHFKPDSEMFTTLEYVYNTISKRIKELAYLNTGLTLTLKDERTGQEETFYYEEGLKKFIEEIDKKEKPLVDVFILKGENKNVPIEIALQYTEKDTDKIKSYVNNISTIEGGTHVEGFKKGLSKAIKNYIKKNNCLKAKEPNPSGDDIREGMTAVISIKLGEPQFESQTKIKLGNKDVIGILDTFTYTQITDFLNQNPKIATVIIDKAKQAAKVREATKKAKENARKKVKTEDTSLPGKLADCREKDPAKSELFIVEGDSAGGSAKSGRNSKFQAILPLRGKILNVEKNEISIKNLMDSKEVYSIIQAIGAGLDGTFDINKVRYHKVIFMTDADVDGSHINVLLMTLFYKKLRGMIEKGYVYLALPPLYKLKEGNKVEYAYDDEDKEEKLKGFNKNKVSIQRYKGLGEMNPEQLWETTMNPENRTLVRITIEDLERAEETVKVLMGKDSEPRKQFIKENYFV